MVKGFYMKKKSIIMAIVIALMIFTIPCHAQTIAEYDMGIAFTLSDEWKKEVYEDGMMFRHASNYQENINVFFIAADVAYDIEKIDEAILRNICDSVYGDSQIAREMSEKNNAVVQVAANSVVSGYEYYNEEPFYCYEKEYTVTSFGFETASFHKSVFITAKNGRFYFITYHRDEKSNHLSDVTDLLQSLSFESGEIKIKINDERIYPDSAPMLIQDRTMVPIRAVAEKMGYQVEWNGNTNTVLLTSKDRRTVLQFAIGDSVAVKNSSQEIRLDVPAFISAGRTYLPLRAVAEAMNAVVNWNGAEKTVEIWE
ncbi:MAG: copper amine oxidase N-terminal domain-containing protein [Ruminococcaceae bacterium]|nr:copper amine oxidase N-terminal domain-containing protein [Oscillospiraceae bacterium]